MQISSQIKEKEEIVYMRYLSIHIETKWMSHCNPPLGFEADIYTNDHLAHNDWCSTTAPIHFP